MGLLQRLRAKQMVFFFLFSKALYVPICVVKEIYRAKKTLGKVNQINDKDDSFFSSEITP